MARLPQIFRKSSDNLGTINITDIPDGVVYKTYYPMTEKTSGATIYKLSPYVVYSNDVLLSGASTTSVANFLSGAFSATIIKPFSMKGNIKMNIPYRHFGGGSPQGMVFANLYYTRGGVQTAIGHQESQLFDATTSFGIINMSIDLASQVNLAKDDTLTLNLLVQGTSNPASTHNVGIDPQNRSYGSQMAVGSTIDTTTSSLFLPILVDI